MYVNGPPSLESDGENQLGFLPVAAIPAISDAASALLNLFGKKPSANNTHLELDASGTPGKISGEPTTETQAALQSAASYIQQAIALIKSMGGTIDGYISTLSLSVQRDRSGYWYTQGGKATKVVINTIADPGDLINQALKALVSHTTFANPQRNAAAQQLNAQNVPFADLMNYLQTQTPSAATPGPTQALATAQKSVTGAVTTSPSAITYPQAPVIPQQVFFAPPAPPTQVLVQAPATQAAQNVAPASAPAQTGAINWDRWAMPAAIILAAWLGMSHSDGGNSNG